MKAVFHSKHKEADNIVTFRFTPSEPVDYIAGQFTELRVPHDNPDDRGIKRWFTLSSAPFDEQIAITTKISEPCSTFKQALLALQPGEEITFAEPMGDFVLPRDNAIPLIFVAGGIGITPFHSMLAWIAKHKEYHNIKLIYAVNNEDEIIFQDTFGEAGISPIIIVNNPSDEWGGERGRLSVDHILKLAEPDEGALIYLSGPEPLIEDIQKGLIKLKVAKEQILTDFFHNYKTY